MSQAQVLEQPLYKLGKGFLPISGYRRKATQVTERRGLIVDLFAGGGGASTGIEMALGRSPDIAINHDREALAMHMANHPDTVHLCQDVYQVLPLHATKGRPVDILWASPDCTHFSVAKGSKPKNQKIRDLAWVVVKWAQDVRPRYIFVENVREFQTWGPLDAQGNPIKSQAGSTFKSWVRRLRRIGYSVAWKELTACDYGAPTSRKRLFIVAKLGRGKVVWPEPTHGPGCDKPWRVAAECIDFEDRPPSIFSRSRPLADSTLDRIAEGIRRYVLASAKPFIVQRQEIQSPFLVHPNHQNTGFRGQGTETPLGTITGKGSHALVTACLVGAGGPMYSGKPASPGRPLGTVLTENHRAVATAHLIAKHYTGAVGQGVERPLGTITAIDHHSLISAELIEAEGSSLTGDDARLTAASLQQYYSSGGQWASCAAPMHTVTSKGRIALQTASLMPYEGSVRPGPGAMSAALIHQYNGASECQPLDEPNPTILGTNKFGLVECGLSTDRARMELVKQFLRERGVLGPDEEPVVTIDGVQYVIVDIGLRMLRPRELFKANGFPEDYEIDAICNGKPLGITSQVKKCGNSVPPQFAKALLQANYEEPSDEELVPKFINTPIMQLLNVKEPQACRL